MRMPKRRGFKGDTRPPLFKSQARDAIIMDDIAANLIKSLDEYIINERKANVFQLIQSSKTRGRLSANRHSKEHHSWGIACFHKFDDGLKLLIVNKRATYAYAWFVRGKYEAADYKTLKKFFDNFTADEKYCIMSAKFDFIWYRAYGATVCRNEYFMAERRFNAVFGTESGKKLLNRLLIESTTSPGVWELPKGRRVADGEYGIDCATREFAEETLIPRDAISIIPDTKIEFNTTSAGGNKFNVIAYAALLKDKKYADGQLNFNRPDQLHEIADMRWVTMHELQKYCIYGAPEVSALFGRIKRQLRMM